MMDRQTPAPAAQRDKIAYAMLIYLAVFLCLFSCTLIVLGKRTLPALLFPAYFIALLLVLTTFNRTMPLRWVLSCFILGATAVPLLTLLISKPFGSLLDVDSVAFYSVIVPILEETLKVVPLLILLLLPRWRYRWTAGASDLLILGAALGAGLGFYEDTLHGFLSSFSPETILSMHAGTPHLGPIYFFPNMEVKVFVGIGWVRGAGGPVAAFIGHGGATAFIGLTIGLVRLLGARLKSVLGGFWRILWLIPLAVWGWMLFDHGMFNYVDNIASLPTLLRISYMLDGYGRVSSFILYLLIFVTICVERWLLWRVRWRTVGLRLSKDRLKLMAGGLKSFLEIPLHLLALRSFLRERRGLSYGLHCYHQAGRRDTARRAYLERLARALLLWKQYLELSPSPSSASD